MSNRKEIDGVTVVYKPEVYVIGSTNQTLCFPVEIDSGYGKTYNFPEDHIDPRNHWLLNVSAFPDDNPILVEAAGRCCYQSWDNPSGKTNKEYIHNLIKQGHESVLEHVSYNFYIRGVSRTLTHELIRHRTGIAISQKSQRYCDESNAAFVISPDMIGNEELTQSWLNFCKKSLDIYREIVDNMDGDRKTVRGVARSVLPGCTETELTWTCNIRELRHIFKMRMSEAADEEIRRLMYAIYDSFSKEEQELYFPEVNNGFTN